MRSWKTLFLAAAAVALLAGGPVAAEKIRIGSPYATTTLDPMRSANAGSIEAFGQLYSRLLRIDETGALAPGLAESWDVTEGGKVVTLKLRDAKFSNGDPIRPMTSSSRSPGSGTRRTLPTRRPCSSSTRPKPSMPRRSS